MTIDHLTARNSRHEFDQNTVKSANLHINANCNYNCKFCFARNLINETMGPKQWEPILRELWSHGIDKINFAGGEPTLHPQFLELCSLAKRLGFVVSVVTNGSKINDFMIERFKGIVDWIGLSIDSPSNDIERDLGRQCGGINHIGNIIKVADMAHDAGIKVKLNITVVRQSYDSDFTDLILRVRPERAKAFQVVKIKGQNEDTVEDCLITTEQWNAFKSRHEGLILSNGEKLVFEGGGMMIDSYLMLDPLGRVMRNSNNEQTYMEFGELIHNFGRIVDGKKYIERGGDYEWRD